MSSSPDTLPQDTTPWYASFWEFCARYASQRFGAEWYLAPEQSLLLLTENSTLPRQVVVCSPHASNNRLDLPFGTSLYDLKVPSLPPAICLTTRDQLRLCSSLGVLLNVSESAYRNHPLELRIILEGALDPSSLLTLLLAGNHSTVAGRLAGALRHIGRNALADEILSAFRAAGFAPRESNPFSAPVNSLPLRNSPVSARVASLWHSAQPQVLSALPAPPHPRLNPDRYLATLDEVYSADAYHSLSIEGYQVSPQLISRVRAGQWQPALNEADRASRDALAARGYWQAFQLVRSDLLSILSGQSPGPVLRQAHRRWYRELFQPSVTAGFMRPADLAGYRQQSVFLRNSRHVPPRAEVVSAAIDTLFDLIENEPNPAVSAVLAHWLFGYIHPFPDGNGRIARFLMNSLLAAAGYPWVVIRVQDRAPYLAALESASVDNDIRPWRDFLLRRLRRNASARR